MSDPTEIVAGVVRDAEARVLTVRKRATEAFMLRGGKRDPGENDLEALGRELREEIGCRLVLARPLGIFDADAANEPGRRVRGAIYLVQIEGEPSPAAEIEEMLWIDPTAPPAARLAPLLETQVLPALAAQVSAGVK